MVKVKEWSTVIMHKVTKANNLHNKLYSDSTENLKYPELS